MKVKALTNFAGIETMHRGETKNIKDEVASDLIKCGYVEEVEEPVSQPPAGSADDGAATPPAKGNRKSADKSNNK